MSFSSDVKKELANYSCNDCCLRAELYAMIKFKGILKLSYNGLGVSIVTSLNALARRIVFLFKKIYNIKLEIIAMKQLKLDKKTLYVLDLTNATDVLVDLKIMNSDRSFNEKVNNSLFRNECCKASVVRGAFLVKGSVNDPNISNYHLEIVLSEYEDAKFIQKILDEVYISAKISESKKGYIVYVKKSEQIGDFLKFVGAINSLFAFEDSRIKRDYSNYVNRIINCDIANAEKVIVNAKKQISQIKYLQKYYGFVNFTQRLMDAVMLRSKFPESSLSELSENSEEVTGKYISKSGLSHCFKDIEKLYNEVKEKRGEK